MMTALLTALLLFVEPPVSANTTTLAQPASAVDTVPPLAI